jgi:hypothetical protein
MLAKHRNPRRIDELPGAAGRRTGVLCIRIPAAFDSDNSINEAHLRPAILVCLTLFLVAMAGVKFAAHEIVATFGIVGGLLTIAAMYGTARYFDRA